MMFVDFWLELIRILMFLAGAGVLDDIFYGLNMPWGSYVENLVEMCWVLRHQEIPLSCMTFLEFLLELMIILMLLTGAGVIKGTVM